MIDSLYIAATGMQSQQTNVDVISNNLANLNTMGFKKGRVNFQDMMYTPIGRSDRAASAAQMVGLGAAVSGTGKVFSAGELKKTEGALDIAIRGGGFLEVTLPDGALAYTRSGNLQVDKQGMLATAEGNPLNPLISVPREATAIAIGVDGKVTATLPSGLVEIGQIEMAGFLNPGGLRPIGENLYVASEDAGQAFYGKPGIDGFGALAQGFLESSNVKMIDEMLNLIVAQRSYEVNSKIIQASDEMLGMVNNLRRG